MTIFKELAWKMPIISTTSHRILDIICALITIRTSLTQFRTKKEGSLRL